MLTVERLKECLSYNPKTGKFRWVIGGLKGKIAGSKHEPYWRLTIDGKRYFAGPVAWLYMTGEWPDQTVDHKDTDGLNNRWDNLRLATQRQNCLNRKNREGKKYSKGVSFSSGRFAARITFDGKLRYLGRFDSEDEAHLAYVIAAQNNFGEFANGG